MAEYGYIRVSTREQNEDRQIIAMADIGIDRAHLFIDKQSGKDFERPAYKKMLKRLKPNDVIFIKSIDRLGRDYDEIQEQWRIITKVKQIDIVVLDMPILDTRQNDKNLMGRFVADLVLQILSFVAEMERVNIKQRQEEGIAAAKGRNVKFGRPAAARPDNFEEIARKCFCGELNLTEGAKIAGMSRTTFGKNYREWREEMVSIGIGVDV